MAIKVNGTTVIDDSRNLANVGGLKTVNGTSLVGSGNISAGASTSYGAVGTYTVAGIVGGSNTYKSGGDTISGSSLKLNQRWSSAFGSNHEHTVPNYYWSTNTLSGTWRVMVNKTIDIGSTTVAAQTLFVRIS